MSNPGRTSRTSRKPRIAWRDTFNVWPDLRITLHLAPWAWRFSWWHDETGSFSLNIGPLTVEWWANRPWFPVEKAAQDERQPKPDRLPCLIKGCDGENGHDGECPQVGEQDG